MCMYLAPIHSILFKRNIPCVDILANKSTIPYVEHLSKFTVITWYSKQGIYTKSFRRHITRQQTVDFLLFSQKEFPPISDLGRQHFSSLLLLFVVFVGDFEWSLRCSMACSR